jgi:hypothetical protein
MPNVVIKITSRIPPQKIGEALGYADEKHKEKIHEEIKVGRGGFLHLCPHDDPRSLLCQKGAGMKSIRMVFSFSEQYVRRLEDQMLHVNHVLEHVVHGTMAAFSTHLFGASHEIGYAIGRHDATDNKHFHLVICPRSWSNKRVCLVGKISPNEYRIQADGPTKRFKVAMDAANRISEDIASGEPGTRAGFMSMEMLMERLIQLVNLGAIGYAEVRDMINALKLEIRNERLGIQRPAKIVAIQRKIGQFLAERGLLVRSEPQRKPTANSWQQAMNPFHVDDIQPMPSGAPGSSGGGRAITWPGLTQAAQEIEQGQGARPAPQQRVEPPARNITPPTIDHGHSEDGGGMRP